MPVAQSLFSLSGCLVIGVQGRGKILKSPLTFLDELAKVRHRIVHASSILEKDQLISVDLDIFHGFYGFYFLLTDFVDSLFSKRFNYPRLEINPAEA